VVSKIQLNEQQLRKAGLPTWDVDNYSGDDFISRARVKKRCKKCGKFFVTYKKVDFVICAKCGKV
jgi:hypothetical protein